MPIENDVLSRWIAEKLGRNHDEAKHWEQEKFAQKIMDEFAMADKGHWVPQQIATGLILDAVAADNESPTITEHDAGFTDGEGWRCILNTTYDVKPHASRYLAARAACEAVIGKE